MKKTGPAKLRTRGRPSKPPGKGKSRLKRGLMTGLRADELQFAAAYLRRFNATRAYLDVHPTVTEATARSEGSRWLHKPNIAQYIKGLVKEFVDSLKSDAKRVLNETAALAFSNLADVYDQHGLLTPPDKLPRQVAVALKKVKRQEILGAPAEKGGERQVLGHTIEVEMHDKMTPLKLLGQHYGMFKEQLEVSGKDLAALLKEGRERSPA